MKKKQYFLKKITDRRTALHLQVAGPNPEVVVEVDVVEVIHDKVLLVLRSDLG